MAGVGGFILGLDLDSARSPEEGPNHRPGHMYTNEVGQVFRYGKFKNALTGAGPVYARESAGEMVYTRLTADYPAFGGILQAAAVSAEGHAWVQVGGLGRKALAVTGVVKNKWLYNTATTTVLMLTATPLGTTSKLKLTRPWGLGLNTAETGVLPANHYLIYQVI